MGKGPARPKAIKPTMRGGPLPRVSFPPFTETLFLRGAQRDVRKRACWCLRGQGYTCVRAHVCLCIAVKGGLVEYSVRLLLGVGACGRHLSLCASNQRTGAGDCGDFTSKRHQYRCLDTVLDPGPY